ncbi:MAG: hypothetical protein IT361_04970 [Gemmatimonadaceae bacterium]|nr:hypothetical protein [Gemmatimonadaceae bacterium]
MALLPFSPRVIPTWQLAIIGMAVATQLLPSLAVLALPRPVPRARYWIGWWGLAFFVSDLSQVAISSFARVDNLWFFLIANPIEDATLLMAFSYWQLRPVMRLSFRVAIPLLALVTLAIAIAFGELTTFKTASSPFRLLLITTAVTYTLVVRTSREQQRIWERDWLWTSLGVTLYYAAYVVVDPVSAALLPDQPELARLVYVVKGAVDIVAFVMVWYGMRRPLPAAEPQSPLTV